jgi:hypothetical protein
LFMKRNFGTNGAIKYILYTINIAINITAWYKFYFSVLKIYNYNKHEWGSNNHIYQY